MIWFLKKHAAKYPVSAVFNWHDPKAKGRICMLTSAVTVEIIKHLSTGVLYTAFLTINGFDIAQSSVIMFLPMLASCVTVFSPVILERFRTRRWLLAGASALYYVINLLGTTAVTYLVSDQQTKLILFGVLVLTANVINSLFTNGYTVWHLNFIPDDIRPRYFSLQQIIISACTTICLFGFSFVADLLHDTQMERTALTVIRLVGFACAVLDVVMLCIPKEYPYPKEARLQLSNIVRLPLKDRKFRLTMGLLALWAFASNLPSSVWNYYLLNTVKMGTVMANLWQIFYLVALLLFSATWMRVLERFSWFKTYGVAALFHSGAVILSAFTTQENYLWVFPLSAAIQAVVGVGLNITASNLPFINMPKLDQSYFICFYTLMLNVTSFLGSSIGSLFVNVAGEQAYPVFGVAMYPSQLLMLIQGGLFMVCAVLILLLLGKLLPDP